MLLRKIVSRYTGVNALLRMLVTVGGLALGSLVFPAGALAQCHFDPNNPVCIPDSNPSTPGRAPKPDVWGAIAITPTLIWGTSWNYKTKAEAQSQALKRCQTQSGTGKCKIAVTVADVCVSLAVSEAQKIYRVGGPTGAINFASNNAMLQCQRAGGKACTIATSFCADGVNHMLQGQTVFSNGNPIFVPQGQGLPAGKRR